MITAVMLFSVGFIFICLGIYHMVRLMNVELPLKKRIKMGLMGPFAFLVEGLWEHEAERALVRAVKRYFAWGSAFLLALGLLALLPDELLKQWAS
ncbi:hypothetical protein [Mitsuaria sp. GD03876]|uniref:hypothetical protein n=1 Tax=Mitsuaria sp. GD03876 TaxID=2975399 RepID=UPI00244D593F|nr:hypothetical protein [Mitsuaria sp. GD03876]MDH0865908.1 hypothetical protein [Mitsuaria sp. GD03876]